MSIDVEDESSESVNCVGIDGDDGDGADVSADQGQNHSLEECIRFWALSSNIPHTSINLLLRIFREQTTHRLPKDARTLLRTNKAPKPNITNIGTGQYWYQGVRTCLTNTFRWITFTPFSENTIVYLFFTLIGMCSLKQMLNCR